MSGSSPYRIVLTTAERAQLEALARAQTAPYRDVVRARIILYAAGGLPNDAIAARLDTAREVVSRWRKRFHERGLEGLLDAPRPGRPGAFPPLRGGRRQGAGV